MNNTLRIGDMQASNTECQLLRDWGFYTLLAMDWRDRFKQRYAELKATEGLTQEKLAEKVGVTQGTIGHWLHGRRSPDKLAMYEKLAEALKMHPALLLYGIEVRMSEERAELNQEMDKLSLSPSEQSALIRFVHAFKKPDRDPAGPN